MELDTRSCYVTQKHDTAIESWYLKPKFKSGRSSIGIWGTITLGLKRLVYFLQKKKQMNSKIYINQVLKKLGLPFLKHCVEEREDIIWMDDRARYHTSKMTTKYCQKFGLLHILWPTQPQNVNPTKNLWRIIKIGVSVQRHRIHSLEEMQKVIQISWRRRTFASALKVCLSVAS